MTDSIAEGLGSSDEETVLDALTDAGKQGRSELKGQVEPFLTSTNEAMREAAIRALAFYWELPEHRETALRLARTSPDSDEGVRAAAVMGLSKYRDADSLRTILEIALDQNENERVRDAAYIGALVMGGISKEDFPMRSRTPGFEQKADWRLLARVLREHVPELPRGLVDLAEARASRS